MSTWLHHPKFKYVREQILRKFKDKSFSFQKIRSVIFLCGGAGSERRDWLAQYLRRHQNALVFYADEVWTEIAGRPGLNALDMEAKLAELADAVIIVVESPGTFAELGAFSLSEVLRRKLLPIVSKEYENSESFIRTGPIRWIDEDKYCLFAPTVWADFGMILDVSREVIDRLRKIQRPSRERVSDPSASPRHLLFFLCDLVSVFGPSPVEDMTYYTEAVFGSAEENQIAELLALGKALDLVRVVALHGESFYYRPLTGDDLPSFRRKKFFELSPLRAEVLSVLQIIDDSLLVIQKMKNSP